MKVEDADHIVKHAIKRRKLVSVDYVKKDGTRTVRLMEPFDVGPGMRSKTGEPKFWGWCLEHERVEQRTINNIVSMQITETPFDPKEHWGQYAPNRQPMEW